MMENRMSGLTWRVLETELRRNPRQCSTLPSPRIFREVRVHRVPLWQISNSNHLLRSRRFEVWILRVEERHCLRRQELLLLVKKIFEDSRKNYGSPRVYKDLRGMGILVNHKTVEKLMQDNGLAAKRRKKFKATTN